MYRGRRSRFHGKDWIRPEFSLRWSGVGFSIFITSEEGKHREEEETGGDLRKKKDGPDRKGVSAPVRTGSGECILQRRFEYNERSRWKDGVGFFFFPGGRRKDLCAGGEKWN